MPKISPVEEAIWPDQKEIIAQLQLCPWLQLPLLFESAESFQEAKNLLSEFAEPKNSISPLKGKWKSLPLKSDNEVRQNQKYADQCPKTLQLLRGITELNSAHAEFILLEPNSETITVPNSADFSFSIFIALNFSADNEFWVDLNQDGSPNRYSRKISFQPGSLILLNNSSCFKIINHSNCSNIFLNFRGPIKMQAMDLIQAARKQNKVSDLRAVINSLAAKSAFLGREVSEGTKLFQDLQRIGASIGFFPEFVAIGVATDILEDPLLSEEALQITDAGLHPIYAESFPMRFIDSWLQDQYKQGKEFAVVLSAGTHIKSSIDFLIETLRALSTMDKNHVPLCGHLMVKKEKIPILHEQFILVNLKLWSEAGVSFGRVDQKVPVNFPPFERSVENIHSDYTPLWIAPSESNKDTNGEGGFGSELMAALLRRGLRIENIPNSLRLYKDYIYPRAGREENYQRVLNDIALKANSFGQNVFVFNTERMKIRNFNFHPNLFMGPCSGLKPMSLVRQFGQPGKDFQFVFIDNNPLAIDFYKKLLLCNSFADVLDCQLNYLANNNCDKEYIEKLMDSVLQEGFEGSQQEFMRCLRATSKVATFVEADYLIHQSQIASYFNKGTRALFWHSNAWEYQPIKYKSSIAGLKRNYRNLVSRICKNLGEESAWIHRNTFEVIIGEDISSPKTVITSGVTGLNLPVRKTYEPLISPLSIQMENIF